MRPRKAGEGAFQEFRRRLRLWAVAIGFGLAVGLR